ncbi:MAG: hypothetical protein N4A36_03440 [Candidatus Gracilibacteria bacterium]|jgi:hypothetical protein|nr:hypothetical protein [Candidatus Gracilibacteria bacterium]
MIEFNKSLAKKFVVLDFEFDVQNLRGVFYYKLDEKELKEELEIKIPKELRRKRIDKKRLNRALFFVHMALGISYYKAGAAPEIVLESGKLTTKQKAFFKAVFEKGLGEFFYQNKIDFRGLINFKNHSGTKYTKLKSTKQKGVDLLCLGGGKDSLASLKLLERAGQFTKGCPPHESFVPLVFDQNPIAINQCRLINKEPILINRKIDPELIRLNQEGFYNGHVPFSFILAFCASLVDLFTPVKNIIVSNEHSANFGNATYLGHEINHQWSKTLEAEIMMSDFIKTYITNTNYFSLMRGFWEIRIAEIFLEDERFLNSFTSCNRFFRRQKDFEGLWCNNCAKCAFIFALFSGFLTRDRLVQIFGENLFEKESLRGTFEALYKEDLEKPFDCVGAESEIIAAMQNAIKIEPIGDNEVILRDFEKCGFEEQDMQKLLQERHCHNISKEFYEIIGIKK